jgi:hypothetical protein
MSIDYAHLVELENRTRDLVEGYDYVRELSGRVDTSYQEMANFYREQMINAAQIVSPPGQFEDKENSGPDKGLEYLKMELQSISHERVIVDVLTRQTAATTRSQAVPPSSSSFRGRSATSTPSSFNSNSTGAATASTSAASEMIPIPEFTASSSAATTSKPRAKGATQVSTTVRRLPPHSLMVPSIRQGSLPPELQGLRTEPTAAPVPQPRQRPARQPKKARTDVAIQGFQQAVKSFKSQLAHSHSDLEDLKEHVDANLRSVASSTFAPSSTLRCQQISQQISHHHSTPPSVTINHEQRGEGIR